MQTWQPEFGSSASMDRAASACNPITGRSRLVRSWSLLPNQSRQTSELQVQWENLSKSKKNDWERIHIVNVHKAHVCALCTPHRSTQTYRWHAHTLHIWTGDWESESQRERETQKMIWVVACTELSAGNPHYLTYHQRRERSCITNSVNQSLVWEVCQHVRKSVGCTEI